MEQGVVAARLYEAHRPALVDYATSILADRARAEDIVQDAWIAFAAIEDQNAIRDPERFLRRMIRNLAIDALRRANRYARIAGGDMAEAERTVQDGAPGTEQALIARQELERVQQALARLPERQRLAIEMHRIGRYKLREIAERLGVSVPFVHGLIVKGLAACDEYCDE
ncbi:sigma-70 family RNA polymerase sigma factor [Sphingobium sp. WCS2017Hpa-17]|uniref:RNA polymerase sigma factor n=1 Tax=Sphingobium sp. WCS2017Hpa-17 TaxID=3073638 RepID=UPI00288A9D1B|nr:sigma-70 family RNA polymerase sigma factor [Sphingobium sp. WCS2017Hpa-17]